jgi:PAS domain-containing protein
VKTVLGRVEFSVKIKNPKRAQVARQTKRDLPYAMWGVRCLEGMSESNPTCRFDTTAWTTPEMKSPSIRAQRISQTWQTPCIGRDRSRETVNVSPIKDAEGDIIGASKVVHDITELVVAREAVTRERELLAAQREWLHTTLTSIGDAVIATDPNGLITLMNPVA